MKSPSASHTGQQIRSMMHGSMSLTKPDVKSSFIIQIDLECSV